MKQAETGASTAKEAGLTTWPTSVNGSAQRVHRAGLAASHWLQFAMLEHWLLGMHAPPTLVKPLVHVAHLLTSPAAQVAQLVARHCLHCSREGGDVGM